MSQPDGPRPDPVERVDEALRDAEERDDEDRLTTLEALTESLESDLEGSIEDDAPRR